MKKIFLAASLMATTFSFVACGNDSDSTVDSLKKANAALVTERNNVVAERDSVYAMLNAVDSTFDELESEYAAAMQEMNSKNPEVKQRKLSDRIAALQETLASNKEKIKQLNGRINNLSSKNKDLQAYIVRLEERSAAQEAQIVELTSQLEHMAGELEESKKVVKGLNKNVDDLTASNQEKDQLIAKQISDANRAWFVVGTYDDLKDAGIVSKSGGFIGIGRKQGTVANMNTEKFTEIDRTKVTTITINLKKPILVTQHPEGSYEFVPSEENKKVTAYLRILNPKLFWQYTDYLVISTK
jgi:uncharacterized coiled-coil protein SlyX